MCWWSPSLGKVVADELNLNEPKNNREQNLYVSILPPFFL